MSTRVATAAGAGPDTRFFVPFMKVEEQSDGSVYVEGIATGEVLDFHGEVVSYEASKAAFEEWSAWAEKATAGESIGNIRVMHQPVVAGKAVKWWADDATRTIHLGARIEDPTAAKLCRSRAYTGFSIGGGDVERIVKPYEEKNVPWIVRYRLSENSIVDKPACPTATFTLVKRAIKETTAMKPLEFLKDHLSAALLCAAAMPEKDTIKIGDETITIGGTPEAPVIELRKDAGSAVVAGGEAIAALKKFMVEVLSIDGDPDLWTIGDICEAMRYCYSARMGAQYASTDSVAAAVAAELKKSENPEDQPPVEEAEPDKPKDDVTDPPAPEEEVPPSDPHAEGIEEAVKAALAPVLTELAEIKKGMGQPVTATLEERTAPEAIVKADLEKFATVESVAALQKGIDEVKAMLEKLPAAPAGRAIQKSIGENGSRGSTNVEAVVKIAEAALATVAAAGMPKASIDAMRIALTTEAMKSV